MVAVTPRHDPRDQRRFHNHLFVFVVHDHRLVSDPHPRAGARDAPCNHHSRRERMSQNRRDFIKFVIAGSVAAGCPVDHNLLAAAAPAHGTRKIVEGEHNEICHKVRDGFQFQIPPVSARKDVVIVGGGVSGLAAAYYMKNHEWMLLEKEPNTGGNASGMDSHGATYATGAAFMLDDKDDAAQLAKELDLALLPINNWDGTIHNGEFVADTWGDGINKLPYPENVREDFKKFKQEILAIDLGKRRDEL